MWITLYSPGNRGDVGFVPRTDAVPGKARQPQAPQGGGSARPPVVGDLVTFPASWRMSVSDRKPSGRARKVPSEALGTRRSRGPALGEKRRSDVWVALSFEERNQGRHRRRRLA